MENQFGKTWKLVLAIHMFLFVLTSFLTFFNHMFHTQQESIDSYIEILQNIQKLDVKSADLTEKAVREFMKSSFDRTQDKQELASQAFHIILGAILSFLSTTAARIFDNKKSNLE